MNIDRREFIRVSGILGFAGLMPSSGNGAEALALDEQLQKIQHSPMIKEEYLQDPIRIESVELLRNKDTFLVRIRSTDGVESITTPNSSKMRDFYPVFINRVGRFFENKNACEIEDLLTQLYRSSSNYKLQGLGFWVCQTAIEMGILDLISKTRGIPLGQLFADIKKTRIAVYRASSNRGNTPEQEIEVLKRFAEETGAKALKIRLGGRMSRNVDSLPGRTEQLIPLVRESFGPEFTLYADSNSSYDVENAIRIGKIMEENDYAFFEEPVPFDHLWETKQVTDHLNIDVAGGEQEFSMRRFRWTLANRAVDIAQPDLHYFGGFIRSVKVARMAETAGLQCTPHMSGSGIGYVNVLHFASFTPNTGPHQEFKGETGIPCHSDTSSLKCEQGFVKCPTGPGMGVEIDPGFIQQSKKVDA